MRSALQARRCTKAPGLPVRRPAPHGPHPRRPPSAPRALQEKLRPELRDEEAALWMTQVLADSASALMPQVLEKAHQWAQYWR